MTVYFLCNQIVWPLFFKIVHIDHEVLSDHHLEVSPEKLTESSTLWGVHQLLRWDSLMMSERKKHVLLL
jgi:hypothetical protein